MIKLKSKARMLLAVGIGFLLTACSGLPNASQHYTDLNKDMLSAMVQKELKDPTIPNYQLKFDTPFNKYGIIYGDNAEKFFKFNVALKYATNIEVATSSDRSLKVYLDNLQREFGISKNDKRIVIGRIDSKVPNYILIIRNTENLNALDFVSKK